MIRLNPFAVTSLITAIICLHIALIVFFYRKEAVYRLWSFFNLSLTVWATFVFLATTIKDPLLSYKFWIAAHLVGPYVAILFFHFANLYCDSHHNLLIKLSYAYGVILDILNINPYFNLNKGVVYLFNSMYYLSVYPQRFLFAMVPWFYLAISGNWMLYQSYKKTCMNENRAGKILLAFTSLGFLGGATAFLPMFGINYYPLTIFTVSFYAIGISYAIFRYKLFEIQILVRKSLIYSTLVTVITLLYFLLTFVLEKLFQALLGYTAFTVSVLAVLCIALTFVPLKNKTQHFLDKYFFKGTQTQIAEENERLRQEVARTEKLKTVATLASGMAHEIKNPLTAIKTFVEYLPERKDNPEFLDKFSRIVGAEVDRIDNLVHQLLEFAKPSPLTLKETDIHQLIDETLSLLNNQLVQHKIDLIRNYHAERNQILNIDPNQIRQALLNIFLNAIEAMRHGGTLTVETQATSDERLIIHIRDTGSGIHPKDLPHVFDPFFSKKDHGTGLGLAITHGIIQEHGGEIKVTSELGKGTEVNIKIPTSFAK